MNEWILSDADGCQVIREDESGWYDVLQIIDTMFEPNNPPYVLKEIFINLESYLLDDQFAETYLKPFGYTSAQEVHRLYPGSGDQILAECVAEIEIDDCGEVVKRGTFKECLTALCKITGLSELEKRWGDELED